MYAFTKYSLGRLGFVWGHIIGTIDLSEQNSAKTLSDLCGWSPKVFAILCEFNFWDFRFHRNLVGKALKSKILKINEKSLYVTLIDFSKIDVISYVHLFEDTIIDWTI